MIRRRQRPEPNGKGQVEPDRVLRPPRNRSAPPPRPKRCLYPYCDCPPNGPCRGV